MCCVLHVVLFFMRHLMTDDWSSCRSTNLKLASCRMLRAPAASLRVQLPWPVFPPLGMSRHDQEITDSGLLGCNKPTPAQRLPCLCRSNESNTIWTSGPLLEAVELMGVFSDSKTFV